ncbi:transposase [Embleya sp. NPDC008237]|uniref:transposase n=1 Tax=Embleya sp. NPDC008237 TaxID=3363978 RepID=UPI0036E6567D
MPGEWAAAQARCARVGVLEGAGRPEKWRLALDTIDTLAGWGLVPPVVVRDAGYRQAGESGYELDARGLDFVVTVRGDDLAQAGNAAPSVIVYSGPGPRPVPPCRTRARPMVEHAVAAGRGAFVEVVRWGGFPRCDALTVRHLRGAPCGEVPDRLARAAANETCVARNGEPPAFTLLTEGPDGADALTDHRLTNRPERPLGGVRPAHESAWHVEHDYRERAEKLQVTGPV